MWCGDGNQGDFNFTKCPRSGLIFRSSALGYGFCCRVEVERIGEPRNGTPCSLVRCAAIACDKL